MKPKTKKHIVAAWASTYSGLGPDATLPELPAMPRPPRPGYIWTADGQEVMLVRAVWYGQRAADVPLSEDIEEQSE
jgi:hypothetical protein